MKPRYMQERWNFDKAAWRQLAKAGKALGGAREYLEKRADSYLDPEDWYDLRPEVADALALLDKAYKDAHKATLQAQADAAHKSGEWGAFAAFCRRRNFATPRPSAWF